MLSGGSMRTTRYHSCAVMPLSVAAMITAACANTPSPAESLRRCQELNASQASDSRAFYARGPLHRQYAEEFGPKFTVLRMGQLKGAAPAPQGSGGEQIANGALQFCTAVHGEAKCRSVVADYAAFEDRANSRLWEETRNKCYEHK
jgi:hypothetical protein